jgi:uncharacterized membrane protein YphA (DoxX/SURF4 family)
MLVRRVARPGIESLRRPEQAAETARPTAEGLQKLPQTASSKVAQDPLTLARVTAAVQIGGGVLFASGKLPRLASVALAATVVPGSLGGHLFWTETDPQAKAQQRREFLTDLSLLGGLMIASVDTEGKPSLGWRGRRAAKRASEAVSAALPVGAATSSGALLGSVGEKVSHGLQTGAERSREFADVAGERVSPLLDVARERGAEFATVARERGAELADVAQKRGAELADTARDRGADWADTAQKRGKKAAKKASKNAQKRADKATKQAQKRLSQQV